MVALSLHYKENQVAVEIKHPDADATSKQWYLIRRLFREVSEDDTARAKDIVKQLDYDPDNLTRAGASAVIQYLKSKVDGD